jgi:two-component system response regulator RegA
MNAVKSILICDDDADLRMQLNKAFVKKGYLVVEASSADDALKLIETFQCTHALIDLRMEPRRSGLIAVEAIHKKYPLCRIVVYTGFGSIQSAVDAIKLGAKEFLTKPVPFVKLFSIVDSADPVLQARTATIFPSLDEVTKEYTNRVFDEFDGNVTQTAKVLGLHRRSLQRKLKA